MRAKSSPATSVAVNHAAPIQVTGNAIAVLGNATSETNASQRRTTGGDITTNGDRGTLSGNIVAEQGATPVQVTNNAVAGAGNACSDSTSQTSATSDGALETSGDKGVLSGTIGGVPIATPVEVTGIAATAIGQRGCQLGQLGRRDRRLRGQHRPLGPSELGQDQR